MPAMTGAQIQRVVAGNPVSDWPDRLERMEQQLAALSGKLIRLRHDLSSEGPQPDGASPDVRTQNNG